MPVSLNISLLFRRYERLVTDGFPVRQLYQELHVRVIPTTTDRRASGALDEWIRGKGSESCIEKEVNKNRRLEQAMTALEREWHTWRRDATLREQADEQLSARTHKIRIALFVAFLLLTALVVVVGVEEFGSHNYWASFMDWIDKNPHAHRTASSFDNSRFNNHQQQQQQNENSNSADGSGASGDGGDGFLPAPPQGSSTWTSWLVRKLSLRDILFQLRGGGAATCATCGEYNPDISFSTPAAAGSSNVGGSSGSDVNSATADDHDDETVIDDEEKKRSSNSEFLNKNHQHKEEGEEDDESTEAAAAEQAAQERQQEEEEEEEELNPRPSEPTPMGRRFLAKASNAFRHSAADFRGVLQPAFLLEATEANYIAHIDWLARRFQPPLQVTELHYEDLFDTTPAKFADAIFWQTGWWSSSSSSVQCCVVFSVPTAIAATSRIRNATRTSMLPYLVEKLTSVARAESFDVQRSMGCKALVVARVDPTTSVVRSKRTYKRLRNMFSSFIL